MATRNFQYDHPHYTVVRSQDMGQDFDVGSNTEFAKFSSKFQCVVHSVDVQVVSAASVASAIITILYNGSVHTMLTFDSANTVGRLATRTLNRTLLSVGDRLGLMHTEGGGVYRVIYTYQVVPLSDVTVA